MSKLQILVTNNHLETYGGSETFTYAFIEGLIGKGHNVEYFTFEKGLTSDKIEKLLKVAFLTKKKFDVVFANHNTCVEFVRRELHYSNIIIQTCHGIYPELEQPSVYADYHVSISEEVHSHLVNKNIESQVILNGINTQRFISNKSIQANLTNVLSLCQSETANSLLKEACDTLNLGFNKLNKFENPIWSVEEEINKCDLVVGLGRSAFEAMSCSRPVLIFDNRPYATSYSDGYLNSEIIDDSIKNNCSGRFFKKVYSVSDIINEFRKYTPQTGNYLRNYVLEHLNIDKQTDKYLLIVEQLNDIKSFQKSKEHLLQKYKLKRVNFYNIYMSDAYLVKKYYRRKRKLKKWLNI
jgi:hypothetical protein